MGDWAKLPFDIIHKLASYLEAIEDFLAFSAVCCSWRSVYLTKQWCPGPQVPWLLLSHNENSTITSFFSLYRNKVYSAQLPETSGKRCLGTSSEWLLIIGTDLQLHLLNVFTRVTKSLPPGSSLQVYFGNMLNWYQIIDKAFVVKKPSTSAADNEELLVMVVFGPLNQLAFCRPGYTSWVSVKDTSNSRFMDVAYVKNQIFALCDMGALMIIDIDGPHPPKVVHVASPNHRWAWKQLFLVESSGDLWMVYQSQVGNRRKSSTKLIRFFVYCFDASQRRWSTLHNLGNHSIFLGDNCSMSVRAPDHLNCKCNSIYFAIKRMDEFLTYREDCMECHLGVYDMRMGVAEPLRGVPDIPKYYSCSLWVMPTLS